MKNPLIVQKAYEIDLEKIVDGFSLSPVTCFAENRNKAKSNLLKQVKYDELCLNHSMDALNFLNIPVRRAKGIDKVFFEGKEIRRWQIEDTIQERERIAKLDEILNNKNIRYCYIYKGGYYRPNHCGYTGIKAQAGVYTKEEAVQHAKSVREIRLEWVDEKEHNKMIDDEIRELQSRILPL